MDDDIQKAADARTDDENQDVDQKFGQCFVNYALAFS